MTTTRYVRPEWTTENDVGYPPPLGRINKAMYVFQMNWAKTRTRRATKIKQLRAVRDACADFVEWFDKEHPECPT